MNKDDYYKISKDQKLPLRCPILNTCQRRASTIYLFSYRNEKYIPWETVLDNLGELSESYRKDKVEIQGEAPEIMGGGANFFFFEHTCPEVPLFDTTHKPWCMERSPCVKGEWDNFRDNEKFKNLEEKHYSECAEFGLWNYSKKKKSRKSVSNILRAKLQQEINSKCPFCENNDVGHFDVHHIDENPANNEMDNLLMICKICHSKISRGELTIDVVKLKKQHLQY